MARDPANLSAPLTDRPLVAPWRSLLICAVLVVLAFAVLRDMGVFAPPPPPPAAADQVAADNPILAASDAESAGLLGRIKGDTTRTVFAMACIAMALFAVIQWLTLSAERRTLRTGRARAGLAAAPGLVLRLLAGRRLHLGQPPDRLSDAVDIAYSGDIVDDPLRLGLTAFPMLGFLGTVIGLSGAIEKLPGAIGNPDALAPVLSELHVAFDTTLLGLIGALTCLIGAKIVEQSLLRLTQTGA